MCAASMPKMQAQETVGDSIYTSPKIRPEFPGGMGSFYKFFIKNYVIPPADYDLAGRVIISFVVEKNGTLSNFKVLVDPGGGLAKAAVETLMKSPLWTAGTNDNGEPVRVLYTLPINVGREMPPERKG